MQHISLLDPVIYASVYDDIIHDLERYINTTLDDIDVNKDWFDNPLLFSDEELKEMHLRRIAKFVEIFSKEENPEVNIRYDWVDNHKEVVDGNHRLEAIKYLWKKTKKDYLVNITL